MIKRFAVTLLCIFIVSCGFKPLNSALHNHSYDEALAKVKIGKIESEYSNILINALGKEFNPGNLTLQKEFVLDANVSSSIEKLLVQKDSTISQQEIKFDVNFTIRDIDTDKVISKGSFPIAVSYAETSSLYSTYVNKEYSYKNGLREVARQLRIRVLMAISRSGLNENNSQGDR